MNFTCVNYFIDIIGLELIEMSLCLQPRGKAVLSSGSYDGAKLPSQM